MLEYKLYVPISEYTRWYFSLYFGFNNSTFIESLGNTMGLRGTCAREDNFSNDNNGSNITNTTFK